MAGAQDRELVHPADRAAWRAWLEANHATSPGCWLVSWRPVTGKPTLDYEDAIQEALCFGWVDSQVRTIDDERAALLYTPRKGGSGWAGTNKRRIAQLEAQGLMRPAGTALIEAAKADGTWTLLDGPEAGIVPDDLAAALDAHGDARATWNGFPPGVRKGMLTWVATAKRAETRAKRVAEIAEQAAVGKRAGEWGR